MGHVVARGEFQDNAISLTQPNLSGLGNDVLAAVSGVNMLAADNVDKAVDDAIARDLAKAETNEFNGRISGSVEGQNKLSLFNTKLREHLIREAKKSKDHFDLLLLDAYFDGEIGTFIGDQVFGAMSDEEIDACVIEIEQETGQSFDEYAKGVLGDDMPERKRGEDDADYHRRVLQAVTKEITGPDGKIKPDYQDDPTARILIRNGRYQEIVQKAEVLDERMEVAKRDGNVEAQEAIIEEVDAEADQGFGVSDALGRNLNDDDLVEVATDAQDEHCRDDAHSDQRINEQSSFLAARFGAAARASETTTPTNEQDVVTPEEVSVPPEAPKPI